MILRRIGKDINCSVNSEHPDFFDLLPGEVREIDITSTKALDPLAIGISCVNTLVL